MKTRIQNLILILAFFAGIKHVIAQGTAWTYQGQLLSNSIPVTGTAYLKFALYTNGCFDGQAFPFQIIAPIEPVTLPCETQYEPVPVTNGLFTVYLDFGSSPNPFVGSSYWLGIYQSTNEGESYNFITNLVPVTPTPYAIYAENAGSAGSAETLSGPLPSTSLSGVYGNAVMLDNAGNSFTGNGSGLTGLNASQISGTLPSSALSGSYCNVSAGSLCTGAAIGSGSGNVVNVANFSFIGGGQNNYVPSGTTDAFIGGGTNNAIQTSSLDSALVGGLNNTIQASAGYSFIGGGTSNQTYSGWSVIGGGNGNYIGSETLNSTIGGGAFNNNTANYATVSGGFENTVGGNSSTVGGGQNNNIPNGAADAFIGGGQANNASGEWAAVSGGQNNNIPGGANYAFIGGGYYNTNSGGYGTLGGGLDNVVANNEATVGGGWGNNASGQASTIPGGYENVASGNTSFAAGANAEAVNDHSFVWSDGTGPTASTANNQFLVRASGGIVFDTSAGPPTSITLQITGSVTLGGGDTIAFFLQNATNTTAFGESGGDEAPCDPLYVVAFTNYYDGPDDNVSSVASALAANINKNPNLAANGIVATWQSGSDNITITSSKDWQGVVPYAYAWAGGGIDGGPPCGASDLSIQVSGFPSPNPTGVELAAGSGSWSMFSDRRAKANFESINSEEVLDEVAAMPVTTWNYKTQAKSIRHIGPMAQDFHAAFGMGENDTTISTVDEGGVALAAIQGLNQKLEEKVKEQDASIQSLQERLDRLEKEMANSQNKQ